MNQIKRFTKNTAGRDFCVGDIHGHFTKLQKALDGIGFDPLQDRLFSVGDLVDRGPDSLDVDTWLLRKPWFHAVRGNHEQMTIDSYETGRQSDQCGMHFINGGAWFYGISEVDQGCYSSILADLPLAIEVETDTGTVGIVHADVPRGSWQGMVSALEGDDYESDHIASMLQWSRKRIGAEDHSGVDGVRAVICGHTPLRLPVVLGNVYHIDTAGWTADGYFTFINLATLETIPPMNQKLEWK
jgi:serine/threonine protein phosphatase 1